MSKNTITRACKIIIYTVNNSAGVAQTKFLLLKRSKFTLRNRGRWDIAGGAAEASESLIDAAIREAAEEISMNLDPNRIVLIKEELFKEEARLKACATYQIDTTFKPQLSPEHTRYKWMSLVELEQTDLPDFYKEVCRTIS